MSIYSTQPLMFGGVQTYPLATRKSKVNVREFARPAARNISFSKFLEEVPQILAAQDLREIVGAIQRAKKQKRAILWGMGGHVIKAGLGRVIADLIARGFVSGIAMNGAAMIHDFEVAIEEGATHIRVGRALFGPRES